MKTSFALYLACVLLVLSLAGCAPAAPTQQQSPPSPAVITAAITSTAVKESTATSLPATLAPTASATTPPDIVLPLSSSGNYFPGKRYYVFERDGLDFGVTIWYPAVKPEGYKGSVASEAVADLSAAPYPLLLISTLVGNELAPHLASHGFVVAGVDGQGPSPQWGEWVIDYPRAILVMLDEIAGKQLEGLEGAVNADMAGSLGYSFDGYNSLALSGARVDPEYFLDHCAEGPEKGNSPADSAIMERVHQYFCVIAPQWETFAAHAGKELTSSEDGLWQPITDARIRAFAPMALEGSWLFGPRGLAAVERPVLILTGTLDELETDYRNETVVVYEQLGSADKVLISFIDQPHVMVFDAKQKARMLHFLSAFFGLHLQGKAEYAAYLTPEYVNGVPGLAWGPYK